MFSFLVLNFGAYFKKSFEHCDCLGFTFKVFLDFIRFFGIFLSRFFTISVPFSSSSLFAPLSFSCFLLFAFCLVPFSFLAFPFPLPSVFSFFPCWSLLFSRFLCTCIPSISYQIF